MYVCVCVCIILMKLQSTAAECSLPAAICITFLSRKNTISSGRRIEECFSVTSSPNPHCPLSFFPHEKTLLFTPTLIRLSSSKRTFELSLLFFLHRCFCREEKN
jgi:hypothetical protein